MSIKLLHILIAVVAFIASMVIFGPILKIAKRKNIVDAPEARKIQKVPIPIMGGIVVFFGILVGLCCFKTFIPHTSLLPVLGSMAIMLYLGAIDDILSISPRRRFAVEILVSLLIIYGLHVCILDFQGAWGIDRIPVWLGVLLSVITFIGIVNSINMIDGVDGLSSLFVIQILTCLGICCYYSDDFSFSALAAVSIGAILPFFLHNVFGSKTKMFIGDSGTLMVGTIISAMVFIILRSSFSFNPAHPFTFNRIAFVVAVLSIPIADTLRVMVVRVLHHTSPFAADNRHFHHILLRIGFSGTFITLFENFLNVLVIAAFLLSWKCGLSLEWQLYITVFVAASLNWGLASLLQRQIDKESAVYRKLQSFSSRTHVERHGLWLKIQQFIDYTGGQE